MYMNRLHLHDCFLKCQKTFEFIKFDPKHILGFSASLYCFITPQELHILIFFSYFFF